VTDPAYQIDVAYHQFFLVVADAIPMGSLVQPRAAGQVEDS
jgi:hypothetical protein